MSCNACHTSRKERICRSLARRSLITGFEVVMLCVTQLSGAILEAGQLDNFGRINTVTNSKRHFSKRDQAKAKLVQRFQHVSGHPSDATLIYSFATNGIKKSPITGDDILIILKQLGKSTYTVQGKTVCHQPDAVDADEA